VFLKSVFTANNLPAFLEAGFEVKNGNCSGMSFRPTGEIPEAIVVMTSWRVIAEFGLNVTNHRADYAVLAGISPPSATK
jgi:hypothetical protein